MQLTRAYNPILHFDDNNGNPLAGGYLYTYINNSTTPVATFADSSGTRNPARIPLNSRGECSVFLDPAVKYKFILTDKAGNVLWTANNVMADGVTELPDHIVVNVEAGEGINVVAETDANGSVTYNVSAKNPCYEFTQSSTYDEVHEKLYLSKSNAILTISAGSASGGVKEVYKFTKMKMSVGVYTYYFTMVNPEGKYISLAYIDSSSKSWQTARINIDVETEKTRAEAAEATLTSAIAAEASTRESADNAIRGSLNSLGTTVSGINRSLSSHVNSSEIHVTPDDKAKWNAGITVIANYGTTSYDEVLAAYNSGNVVFVKAFGNCAPLVKYSDEVFTFSIPTYSNGATGVLDVTLKNDNRWRASVNFSIGEAPQDGKQYARQDGSWTEVQGGSSDVEEMTNAEVDEIWEAN